MKIEKMRSKNSSTFNKSKLHLAALLMLSSFAPMGAYAQNAIYEWNGSNGDASDHSNWNYVSGLGGVVEAVVNQSGHVARWEASSSSSQPDMGSGINAELLSIGNAAGSNGEATLTRPAYDVSNPTTSHRFGYVQQIHVGMNGGKGTLNIDSNDSTYPVPVPGALIGGGPSHILDMGMLTINGAPDSFAVGVGAGSEGRVNLLGSGKSVLEQQSYPQQATLNVETSGSGAAGDDTKIGADGGKGYINVDGGSVSFRTSSSSLVLGRGAGSHGEINVLGGGKFAHHVMYPENPGATGESFIVGDQGGSGVFNVKGRSATKDARSRAILGTGMTVGSGAGSVGQVVIDGGAQIQSATSEYAHPVTGLPEYTSHKIGVNGGQGYVTIDGKDAGGNPSIWKVLGKNNGMTNGTTEVGELHVGYSGTGEITLSNGGTLSIGMSEYDYIYVPDPNDPGQTLNYRGEVSHTGGLGTLYMADTAGSKGTLNIGAPAGRMAQGVGHLAVKDIELGAGNASIVFNHTDSTGAYVFDTPLVSGSGYGVVRQLAGTTVWADQPLYTGDLSIEGGHFIINGSQTFDKGYVSGGILEVNGSYTASQTDVSGGYFDVHGVAKGSMVVRGSGTLTGEGKAGDVVVNAGGTVFPGHDYGQQLGVLTVDRIVFNPGSTLRVLSNPDHTSDLLYATTASGGSGVVTINGGTVVVVARSDTWEQDTRYEIIKADAGITGNFETVKTNLAFLTPTFEYDSNTAYLYMTRNKVTFPEVGVTENQRNTGWGVQTLYKEHPVYHSVVSMSADQARISFDNLSGEIHADVQAAILMNNRYSRDAVKQHLGMIERGVEPNKNLWIDGWAHTGHVDGDGNAARFNHKGAGVLIGADVFSNGVATIGLAAGYEQTRLSNGDLRNSDADLKTMHLMAYGGTSLAAVDFKGGVGYAYIDADTTRHIFVPGLVSQSKGKYKAHVWQLFAEASHTFNVSERLSVTPYVGGVYQNSKIGSFTEKNSLAALQHKSESVSLFSGLLGVKGRSKVTEKVELYSHLGWKHNFDNKASSVNLNFIGGGSFKVRAPRTKADSVLVDVGATFNLKTNMKLEVGYSGEFSGSNKDHGAKVLFQYKF